MFYVPLRVYYTDISRNPTFTSAVYGLFTVKLRVIRYWACHAIYGMVFPCIMTAIMTITYTIWKGFKNKFKRCSIPWPKFNAVTDCCAN